MPNVRQAIVLRVHRNIAGVSFPWDCVYFFRRTEESLLPKIFPCSLVVNLTPQFTRLIKKAVDNPRGDKAESKAYPHHRRDEHTLTERVKRQDPLRSVLEDPKAFVGLIPTLHLKGAHEEGKSGPAYLTARPRARATKSTSSDKRKNRRGRMVYANKGSYVSSRPVRHHILLHLMGEALSNQAYFLFHGEKIQPVCLCCPNNLDFLDGKCFFGETRCYESLDQARTGDFVEALHVYKQYVQEASVRETTDEQLSRDTN